MPAPSPKARQLARALVVLLLLVGARALLASLGPALARQLGAAAVDLADRGLLAAVWLAAAYLLIRALDACVWSRSVPHPPRLLKDLVAGLVWLVVALAVAGRVLELPLAGIVTTSSVAVAVVGFALRDMLASLFAGIALNLEGPFRIGDWLEIGPGSVGEVVEIGWLTTRLATQEGIGLVVPNAQLATRSFKNFNHRPGSWRDQVTVTLGYDVSPARAERILLAAAAQAGAGGAAGGEPEAVILACGEHGVVWELDYPVASYPARADTRHQVNAALLRHLYKAGLAPAPRRLDLFHAAMPARAPGNRTQLDVLLARSDLFGRLGQEQLGTLGSAARRRRVPAQTVVVRQGEAGSSLFVVVEGVLDVEVALDAAPPRWAHLLAPGDMFGEFSLLTGEPRSATVTARTNSLLFEITKTDLDPLLQRSPDLAEGMSRTLAARQAARQRLGQAHAGATHPAAEGEQGLRQRIRAFFGLAEERS